MSLVKLRGVRRMITVEILDALYLNGEQLSGVFKTSSDGLYAIDSEVLKELIAKSKRCLELEKSSSHMMSMLKSGKLASNEKEKPDKTPGEILGELSAKARIAKKQQAIVDALRKTANVIAIDCTTAEKKATVDIVKDNKTKYKASDVLDSMPDSATRSDDTSSGSLF